MQGSDIYLRPLELEDISRTATWLLDPEISIALDVLPRSRAHQEHWFQSATLDSGKFIFAVCRRTDDEHLGNVSLTAVDVVNRHALLSAFIAARAHRRKGFSTQAVRLLLAFAFGRLNLHRVHLKMSAESPGVASFYERLGFVREGLWRQHAFVRGAYQDRILYGLLAGEFLESEAAADSSGHHVD